MHQIWGFMGKSGPKLENDRIIIKFGLQTNWGGETKGAKLGMNRSNLGKFGPKMKNDMIFLELDKQTR